MIFQSLRRMDAKTGILTVLIITFIGGLIFTFTKISSLTSPKDNPDFNAAVSTVSIVNAVLIMILGGAAYFYMAVDDSVERPYITVMLHFSLLLSLMAVSISVIQKTKA
jgi:hypothetical protein